MEQKRPKYDEVYEYEEVPVDENGNEIRMNEGSQALVVLIHPLIQVYLLTFINEPTE